MLWRRLMSISEDENVTLRAEFREDVEGITEQDNSRNGMVTEGE